MPPVTVEMIQGQFYIVHSPTDKERAMFPRDSQHQSAPCLIGFDYATGNFVPASMTADGKLHIAGVTIEHAEFTIGAVEISDMDDEDTRVNVAADGGKNAMYVRSNSLANNATLLLTNTALGTINTSINTQVDTKTSVLKTSIDAITTKLGDNSQKTQIVDGSGNTIGIGAKPIFIDDSPMGKQNITAAYTYYAAGPAVGKVETIKEYVSGSPGGSPAKLTTYVYDGTAKVISITTTDSTV